MNQPLSQSFKRYLRWSFLSSLTGILAGFAAAAFLILLEWMTNFRNAHPQIIWCLPLAGFAIGMLYHHFGRGVEAGNNLILDEIHDPRNVVPLRMAPFIFVGTVLTHLFGGSAGREGTAVQMGASLADQLTHLFRIEPEERKILLVAGAGAGFAAAIGAPWAGAAFGMEVIVIGRLRFFAWFECLVASFFGYYIAVLVGAHHSAFPVFVVPAFDIRSAALVAVAGVAFGLAVIVFVRLTHFIERMQKRFVGYAPLRPLIAGIVLVALYRIEGTYRFVGLGIPEIHSALRIPGSFSVPALKEFFTALTIGSGFKGGEFVPLVFVGATLGSALSSILPVPLELLASVGFVAVFAGASNTPVACSIMATEIFGYRIAPYAVIACFASYYVSKHHGIYGSQRIHVRDHEQFWIVFAWLRNFPRRFLNGNGKDS